MLSAASRCLGVFFGGAGSILATTSRICSGTLKRKALDILSNEEQAEAAAAMLENAFLEKSSRQAKESKLDTLAELAAGGGLRLFPLHIRDL